MYRKSAEELEDLIRPLSPSHLCNQKRIFGILKGLEHLCQGNVLLHKRFFSMMQLKFCLDVSMLLACSYYFIEYWKKNCFVFVCWESVVVFQSFISLWIICHTADRVRQSVKWLCHYYIFKLFTLQTAFCLGNEMDSSFAPFPRQLLFRKPIRSKKRYN